MNKSLSSIILAAALVATATVPSHADTDVCITTEGTFIFGTYTSNELGIVIAQDGSIVATADNYQGQPPVSDFWENPIPGSVTLPAGCYTYSISAKATPPNAEQGWICGDTLSHLTLTGLLTTGSVTYPGFDIPTPVGTVNVIAGISQFDDVNDGGSDICPPPGQ